jgi:hypothetical protein
MKRAPFRSSNRNTFIHVNGWSSVYQLKRPTSDPSVNRPDCSQSSWEEIDDNETFDAPVYISVHI